MSVQQRRMPGSHAACAIRRDTNRLPGVSSARKRARSAGRPALLAKDSRDSTPEGASAAGQGAGVGAQALGSCGLTGTGLLGIACCVLPRAGSSTRRARDTTTLHTCNLHHNRLLRGGLQSGETHRACRT